jgi:L,D-transpeptidase ErfK/SrfK
MERRSSGWWLGAGAIAAVLLVARPSVAGRWTEEDFARRVPVTYQFAPRSPAGEQTVTGALNTYVIEDGDTLLDIARHFSLGYNDIVAANPGVDAWLPASGEVVIIPTEFVLPDTNFRGLVVNIPEMRLYYFKSGGGAEPGIMNTYPVGLGRDDWQTPQGSFRITGKTENPTWIIPESIRAEHIKERGDHRTMIPGGDPDNPLGPYRFELSMPMYRLHGTNVPWGVGMHVSHGCIRFYNEDVARLFAEVKVGTPGEFIYQPVKIGVRDGLVYAEVHPDIYGLRSDLAQEAENLLAKRGLADAVDRTALRQALAQQSGLPVMISRDPSMQSAAVYQPAIVAREIDESATR